MEYFTSTLLLLLAAVVLLAVKAFIWNFYGTLEGIRGPKPSSFLMGNETDIRYQAEVGDVEFAWLRKYGGAWKIYGPLGDERLMLADPKALQYVLQTSGYCFPKRGDWRAQQRMRVGDGIAWVHGEQHRRHKKIMSPAFTTSQLKSFLPLFLRHADRLVQKWREEIPSEASVEPPLLNVHNWISRTTLDIIGEAAFHIPFGALDDARSELSEAYRSLYATSTLYLPRWDLVFRFLWKNLPPDALWYLRYLPSRGYSRFRRYQDFIRRYGRELVVQARTDSEGAEKDIMSVLMRANEAQEEHSRLSDIEVIDQISTIILAGHETGSSTLTWYLWELARHVEWQSRLREEIQTVRRQLLRRGDNEFSTSDLEAMPVLQATMKEAMRLHPIAWLLHRTAGQDDLIPLSTPIATISGEHISSIPVRKGQNIEISISAYSRNPTVWGEDVDVWNPERFLVDTKTDTPSVGMYANLLAFSAGVRGCIGYRFALLEMLALSATIIENFEVSLPPQTDANIIRRKPSLLMAPMADGHPGIWMGLKVKRCDL